MGLENFISSKGLGEKFEGDFADMCGNKILIMSMGNMGAKTHIGVSRN